MKLQMMLASASLIALAAFSLPAQAQGAPRTGSDSRVETITLLGRNDPYVQEVSLPAGKSTVLRFDVPIIEASVGNPDFADIVPLTDRSLYLLGRQNGSTNLTVFGANKEVLGVIDVNVTYDTVAMKKRLHEVLPGEDIRVHTNGDTVMLSGKVSSSAVGARAMELAQSFAPGKVLNTLEIGAPQQVMLAVRFAEIERSAAKQLGISTNVAFTDNGPDNIITSFLNPNNLRTSSFALIQDTFDLAGDATVDVLLDALEQKGVASILAEPTLMAISGEPASFLAGGEFPVPVSATGDGDTPRISIEFKEFGVRLAFTPTVIGDKISLVVSPEVSELDTQNGVELNNVVIPGLRTRKATTTVELKNGQSFAIAGLIQKDFLDGVTQMPGLGNVPIIGALARSARYQRSETELAIIITPYIVEPSTSASLKLPTDYFSRPHEFELFFLGKTEAGTTGMFGSLANVLSSPGPSSTRSTANAGAVGYVLE